MKIVNSGIAGDLTELTVTVNEKDITEAVNVVHIYQNMTYITNSGALDVVDTRNLLMQIPLNVGAKVKISYTTKTSSETDGTAEWDFIIYRIGDKVASEAEASSYTVYMADESLFLSQNKRIYKSFQSSTCADMVSKIVSEHLDVSCSTHPDDKSIQFISPGWSPFRTIAWLTKVATRSKAADYFFFQYADRSFGFKSFEELYASNSESCNITLDRTVANLANSSGDVDRDAGTAFAQFSFEHFDGLLSLAGGYFKSKLATYDIITKKWEIKEFKLGDDNSEDKNRTRDDSDLFLQAEDPSMSFSPKHAGMFSNPSYLDNVEEWQMSRKSSVLKFEQEKLLLQVAGGAKVKDWFAKNCEVDLPSMDSFREDRYDRYRRGRYLITAIHHNINKTVYRANIQLCKKRLEE